MGNKRVGEASDKAIEICEYSSGDERQILTVLANCGLLQERDEAYWRWKNLYRPESSSSDIVEAKVSTEIIGVYHSALLPVKLENEIEVLAGFGGDFAILPEYRGKHIPVRMFQVIDNVLRQRGMILRAGWSAKGLYERFYKKFGQVLISTVSIEYTKLFDLSPLREKVEKIGKKILELPCVVRAVGSNSIAVNLVIESLEPWYLEFTGRGLSLHQGYAEKAILSIRARYGLLNVLTKDYGRIVMTIVHDLVTGRLRVGGIFRNGPALGRLIWSLFVNMWSLRGRKTS